MSLTICRRFRGNLYGSTDVSALEDQVISHPYFQRLRRIKQTAFLSYAFPGATHTRFEHSLGVLHLVTKVWKKLGENQERIHKLSQNYTDFAQQELSHKKDNHGALSPTIELIRNMQSCSYTQQALRLAALMHDIGHPPFSHTGESFLPAYKDFLSSSSQAPNYLIQYLEKKAKLFPNTLVSHEVYSALAIVKVLTEIYANDEHINRILPQDVVAILIPEIGFSPQSPLITNGSGLLCHELVSGELDVDRMDYLLRDARECGVVYGIFDVERIFDSICTYYSYIDKRLHLAIKISGLSAFEDYLRARQSMYIQLYFHKTSIACEAMIHFVRRHISKWHLPVDIEQYMKIDDHNITYLLEQAIDKHSPLQKIELIETIHNLIYKRKLWSRVYEIITSSEQDIDTSKIIKKICTNLHKKNISYQEIFSCNYLTKFSPREREQPSSNYLRLIKKDEHQFPRVIPIEDFSNITSKKSAITIRRIYANCK